MNTLLNAKGIIFLRKPSVQNDSLDYSVSAEECESGWLGFFTMCMGGLPSNWPTEEGYIGCHTLGIYSWFFCFGGHGLILLHPPKPQKVHFCHLYSVTMLVNVSWSHYFSPEDCGLSGYKDVAGELRGKPRTQKLLAVESEFFFLSGLKHCSSHLPVRGCVLLSEEGRVWLEDLCMWKTFLTTEDISWSTPLVANKQVGPA